MNAPTACFMFAHKTKGDTVRPFTNGERGTRMHRGILAQSKSQE